jgi:hypothetical protein
MRCWYSSFLNGSFVIQQLLCDIKGLVTAQVNRGLSSSDEVSGGTSG